MSEYHEICGVVIKYDDDTHKYYRIAAGSVEIEVPSVTTILNVIHKPFLIPWAAKLTSLYWLEQVESRNDYAVVDKEARAQWREKRDTAGDLGTHVHALIEARLKGVALEPQTPEAGEWCDKFFEKLGNREVVASEQVCYLETPYGEYAGRYDILLEGELVDIKTSNYFSKEWWLQTAAYAAAIQNTTEQDLPGYDSYLVRSIYHLDKDKGEWSVHHRELLKNDTYAFLAALQVFNWQREQK